MNEEKVLRLFTELIDEMKTSTEGKKKIQNKFMTKLDQFLQTASIDMKLLDDLPFPIALFDRDGLLISANKILAQAADISGSDLAMGRFNFLNRIVTENDGVLDAAECVFRGETSIVRDLEAPISMFVRDDHLSDFEDDYQTGLFFPIGLETDDILCGAVVLMRQRFD